MKRRLFITSLFIAPIVRLFNPVKEKIHVISPARFIRIPLEIRLGQFSQQWIHPPTGTAYKEIKELIRVIEKAQKPS